MKKFLSAIIASAMALGAVAQDEVMTVSLTDGTRVQYNVQDVYQVTFETISYQLTVTPAEGEAVKYTSIPTVFRISATEDGQPTRFAFGDVEAKTPADLLSGRFGLWMDISAVKVYNGEFDLAENPDSYTLRLMEYSEGGLVGLHNEVATGTISSSINNRNHQVTLNVQATFTDGTAVSAEWEGMPLQADDFECLIPEKKMDNEVVLTYATTGTTVNDAITGMTVKEGSSSDTYTFLSKSGNNDVKLTIYNRELVNAGALDMGDESVWGFNVTCGNAITGFGRRSLGDTYSNNPTNGTLRIAKADDGTYEVYIDFQFTYKPAYGTGTSGDGTQLTLHYQGPAQ